MARASGKVPIHLPVALPETLTPFPPWCGWVRLGAAKNGGESWKPGCGWVRRWIFGGKRAELEFITEPAKKRGRVLETWVRLGAAWEKAFDKDGSWSARWWSADGG